MKFLKSFTQSDYECFPSYPATFYIPRITRANTSLSRMKDLARHRAGNRIPMLTWGDFTASRPRMLFRCSRSLPSAFLGNVPKDSELIEGVWIASNRVFREEVFPIPVSCGS